jgi:ribosome-associated protein
MIDPDSNPRFDGNKPGRIWGIPLDSAQETRQRMQLEELENLVIDALDDMKARDIEVIDVRGKTNITDVMIVASGTSNTHVKAIAETLAFRAKEAGERPLGTEGVSQGEWALIDLNDVVVHVMLPKVRDFYHLERLWGTGSPAAGKVEAP